MSTEQERYKNTSKAEGGWVRAPTHFHERISRENGAKYPPEAGRYRLYASPACPWAHRTLILRKMKGLEDVIALTLTGYRLDHLGLTTSQSGEYRGWNFVKDQDENSLFYEPHGFDFLGDLYEHASPGYKKGYVENNKRPVYSVPVLFDEKTQTIVSNESSEIIVMFNDEFNEFAKNPDLDLNPKDSRTQKEMERVNSVVYPAINDGVYRCGFARSQSAYEDAYKAHWDGMDEVENLLGSPDRTFLCGTEMTLSDIRLFVTLIRYDIVYFAHFKTSRNLIVQMPNMYKFLRRMYQIPEIKETVNAEFIVKHYYGSQKMINPTGIWPLGPLRDDALKHLENPLEKL